MGGLVLLLFALVGLGGLAFWVASLVDMARRPEWQWKMAGQEKILWIILVCVANALAIVSLVYWFAIRPKLVAVEGATPPGFGPAPYPYAGFPVGFPAQSPGAAPQPGWYADPFGAGPSRYWDGSRWI